MRFLEVLVLLEVALFVGCSSPTGQSCERSRCPDGYACVSIVDDINRCMPECEQRSDCRAPAVCIPRSPSNPSFACDEGNREGRLDDACLAQGGVNELDICGPGLECSPSTRVCLPRCNAYSPHSEDRSCGAGFRCDAASTWPEERSVCFRECDPSVSNACGDVQQTCVRFRDESGAILGLCQNAGSRAFCPTQCLTTEVCVDDVCYPSISSPPLPWTQPELPPLVD